MQSDLDGNNVVPFFRNMDNIPSKECTCSYNPSVKSVMTIDKTNIQKPMMYWMSLEGYLNVADMHGCMCNTVLNASSSIGTSLTVDKMNVYWSDLENDEIVYTRKGYSLSASKANISEPEIKSFKLSGMLSIKAIGRSLQPYPTVNCLIPRRMVYRVERLTETANSITMKLPKPVPDHGCERYNLPTTLYTIHVSQCLVDDSDECKSHEGTDQVQNTYERQYEIQNLKPFTEYRLKLALSNYYADLISTILEFNPGIVLRTGPGPPSVPENVTVEALTPTSVAIYWMPPKILNSAAVNYEVHWGSPDLVNGVRQKEERLIEEPQYTADGRFYTTLHSLLPGREYVVYVRVYSVHSNEFYNQSPVEKVQTFPEPNNLTVTGASVNSLNVCWIPSLNPMVDYVLEYRDVAKKDWKIANDAEVKNDTVTYHIEDLEPSTSYKFRLILKYPAYKENFVWPPDEGFTFKTEGKRMKFFYHAIFIQYVCYRYENGIVIQV